jgi:hypothetical protein
LKVGTRCFSKIQKRSARRASPSIGACGGHCYA